MTGKRPALALLVATALLQLLAPPYYGQVGDGRGGLHASLGHAFRWAPPSPDVVCEAIRTRQARARAATLVDCPPTSDRRSLFQVHVNVVRTMAESLAAVAAALVLRLGGRRRRPASAG